MSIYFKKLISLFLIVIIIPTQIFAKNNISHEIEIENTLHIFSGWEGKCVSGKKWDSSYMSDPMTIMSYAMMAYNSYTQVNGTSLADEYGAWSEGVSEGAAASGSTGQAMTNASSSSSSAFSNSNGDFLGITKMDIFIVRTAMVLAAPEESDYDLADRLMKGYLGQGDDTAAQAYNTCMASIGLSFPNMLGWSMDENSTSENLKAPYEHPLRMTTEQLASIATVFGEDYVIENYMYNTEDNILLNVIALNGHSYIKAGEVICAGIKVSKAMAHKNSKSNSASGGGKGMAIAMMAVSMICPVCGFVLKVVMDLYSNMLASINTCDNEQDAMEHSMLHYKTHKFLSHDQCHLADTYCDKESSWLGCVRKGYDYCCYDQVTTKIFAEGLKAQLNKNWDSCVDITVNDLKDISFRSCREGEIAHINKCFPMGKYDEFQKALFKQATKGISIEGLTEQVINSMAIDTDHKKKEK
ncbi:MAG: hypothetical protein DRG78_02590 [Epsilonproteobacteria bacterium]|nr:MAG: hypothetical protein DRG78_02590 [Campylobacterota bacterium]